MTRGVAAHYEDTFKDTGCHLHPKCLECPREICILDEPIHAERPQRIVQTPRPAIAARVAQASEMYSRGMTYREIARALGCDPSNLIKLMTRWAE